jgi:hypothetical protein
VVDGTVGTTAGAGALKDLGDTILGLSIGFTGVTGGCKNRWRKTRRDIGSEKTGQIRLEFYMQ